MLIWPGYVASYWTGAWTKLASSGKGNHYWRYSEICLQVGKIFKLDDIVEAHKCMEQNNAGGKIVVLT